MVELDGDKEERRESPVYTGPQIEAPISSNRIAALVLVSGLFVFACVLLIVIVAITR